MLAGWIWVTKYATKKKFACVGGYLASRHRSKKGSKSKSRYADFGDLVVPDLEHGLICTRRSTRREFGSPRIIDVSYPVQDLAVLEDPLPIHSHVVPCQHIASIEIAKKTEEAVLLVGARLSEKTRAADRTLKEEVVLFRKNSRDSDQLHNSGD